MASIAQSLNVTENMLTAHPDLNGIFCSNESGSAGAAQALEARHSKLKLVGFDSSPTLINQLKAGWIDSLVVQDPFKMGEIATLQAVKAIRREPAKKDIFLPPRVVNLANLNDPDIQAQLHPDLKALSSHDRLAPPRSVPVGSHQTIARLRHHGGVGESDAGAGDSVIRILG